MTILTISNITIHQDADGRYSLNDLHKAAGNKQKHKPVHWQALQQTKELIEEISKVEIPTFIPLSVKKGCYGGTYVCKELVYSYAMWISAEFSLKVIRAYDSLVRQNIAETTPSIEPLPKKPVHPCELEFYIPETPLIFNHIQTSQLNALFKSVEYLTMDFWPHMQALFPTLDCKHGSAVNTVNLLMRLLKDKRAECEELSKQN
ncbi:KilA-N domain-containing protein [Pectobacterium versatile]|uniref:KilA-N domain-containing protein n=1 Tax=Pectobacterium versatile TaxID=2488639 RepID=A0ABU8K588_9GAMM|nr:KilA-N domain-containing protein [Pectobacterium parvum]UVD96657.1 KilA-N domain-containing protein [Pectobacterium parvum]